MLIINSQLKLHETKKRQFFIFRKFQARVKFQTFFLFYFILIDYIWLHIRAVGEWTNSLYSYFEKEQMKLQRDNIFPIENRSNPNVSESV